MLSILPSGHTISFRQKLILKCQISFDLKYCRLMFLTILTEFPSMALSSHCLSYCFCLRVVSLRTCSWQGGQPHPTSDTSLFRIAAGDNNLACYYIRKAVQSIAHTMFAHWTFPVTLNTIFPPYIQPVNVEKPIVKCATSQKILLADSCPCKRIPVLRILNCPFKIPNIHSTSFCMDSSHCEKRICDDLLRPSMEGQLLAS